eukprot:TRINITY_DN74904_c0_g1_i1.p1 TRINITY_DN74904_c0_g1~~TRINITY_DN74904_c0_g1_i1.p1  ORF type:complete len:272 (-),score=70.37 TRINITY_DN74904_c0_g1_i1:117-932(-)
MGGEGGNLKHVAHRRVHLERQQPLKRRKLGTLEKKKDYVKRAKDYHRKQDALKALHRKAYFRNEDEFAFGMLGQKVVDGRVRKKEKASHLAEAEEALADSQDKTYVAYREHLDKRAVEKKKANLHFLDADRPNKHVLFVDEDDMTANNKTTMKKSSASAPPKTGSKTKLRDFDVAAHLDTHPDLLGKKANRPRMKQLETGAFAERRGEADFETRQEYKELFHLQQRSKALKRVREELETRKNLRGKGQRVKIAPTTKDAPDTYMWFPERQR